MSNADTDRDARRVELREQRSAQSTQYIELRRARHPFDVRRRELEDRREDLYQSHAEERRKLQEQHEAALARLSDELTAVRVAAGRIQGALELNDLWQREIFYAERNDVAPMPTPPKPFVAPTLPAAGTASPATSRDAQARAADVWRRRASEIIG